jgi:phage-related protein (TIGR01555 family)
LSRSVKKVRTAAPQKPITEAERKAAEVQQEITMRALDAWANPSANLGWGSESMAESTKYPLTRLTQNYMLMLSLYRGSGILRRIVDKIPEDAIAHWFKIDSQITPDRIDALERLMRRTKIKRQIEQGLKWARLFGGAAGLIMIDGQGDMLEEPLDLSTVEPDSFKGIYVVDRWSGVYPSTELVDDIGNPAFGEPEYYYIRASEEATNNLHVHHSRILRFAGDELPYWEKQVEQHWGTSVVETIFDSLKRYDNTLGNIAQLLFQANTWVQKSDMLEQLTSIAPRGMQNSVIQTLQAQQALMSSFRTRYIGPNDDLQNHTYTFAGLDKVFEVFQYDMSSVSGYPVTVLFGRSAAGLNATGDADMDNYYAKLEGVQENDIRPPIEQLLPIMCMSEFGAVPDDINVIFNPVRVPSEKEKAEIADSKVTAIVAAHTAGIISDKIALKELQALAPGTDMFSNITDKDVEGADDVPDAGDETALGSYPNFAKKSSTGSGPASGGAGSQMSDEEYTKRYGHNRGVGDADPDWDEADHPRADNGRFGRGGGAPEEFGARYRSKSNSGPQHPPHGGGASGKAAQTQNTPAQNNSLTNSGESSILKSSQKKFPSKGATGFEMAKFLESEGYVKVRQSGTSHALYEGPNGEVCLVPMHGKPLSKGVYNDIKKRGRYK